VRGYTTASCDVSPLRPAADPYAMPVDLLVRTGARGAVAPSVRRALTARVRAALRALSRSRCGVTVVLTDDPEIRQLNRDFRRHDRATDVLSFQLQELGGVEDPAGEALVLGDIVISVETARRRAGARRLRSELERLAIHGLCHLFGHDHKRKPEATVMFAIERRLRRLPLRAAAPASGSRKRSRTAIKRGSVGTRARPPKTSRSV